MANFDSLLSGLHEGAGGGAVYGGSQANLIVDAKRQFSAAEGFDTTIGYEGDVNSQVIVIELPSTHAGHELFRCTYKELRWKNQGSQLEGVSKLNLQNESTTNYEWEVPSDLMVSAGIIELSISFYDKIDDKIAFAWNTAPYFGLKIQKTTSSVGLDYTGSNYPARDDILFVDEETRNIIAPTGYNNIICNYGDVGVAEVYFAINRYLGKNHIVDVLEEAPEKDVKIAICVATENFYLEDSFNIIKEPYFSELDERNKEGLVLVRWVVPQDITEGAGPGKLQVAIRVTGQGYSWVSNVYSNLQIGHSLFEYNENEPGQWGTMQDYINQAVYNYFNNEDIILNANED